MAKALFEHFRYCTDHVQPLQSDNSIQIQCDSASVAEEIAEKGLQIGKILIPVQTTTDSKLAELTLSNVRFAAKDEFHDQIEEYFKSYGTMVSYQPSYYPNTVVPSGNARVALKIADNRLGAQCDQKFNLDYGSFGDSVSIKVNKVPALYCYYCCQWATLELNVLQQVRAENLDTQATLRLSVRYPSINTSIALQKILTLVFSRVLQLPTSFALKPALQPPFTIQIYSLFQKREFLFSLSRRSAS